MKPLRSLSGVIDLPKKLQIIEVGPRDGLQNEKTSLSVGDRIAFIEKLTQAGHRRIEVGSFVNPEWVPQMHGSFEVAQHFANAKHPTTRYSALVPNQLGYEIFVSSGLSNIAMVVSATESFNQKNLNMPIAQSLKTFAKIIPDAKKNRYHVRVYLSVAFGCPYEGPVTPKQVLPVVNQLLDYGADEISISDTIGVALPDQVDKLIGKLARLAPKKRFALHFHDTRGTALANILVGLQNGITVFDASTGGLGGCPFAKVAAGNVATEDLLYMLNGMGYDTGIDLKIQVECGHLIQKLLNKQLPSRYLQLVS